MLHCRNFDVEPLAGDHLHDHFDVDGLEQWQCREVLADIRHMSHQMCSLPVRPHLWVTYFREKIGPFDLQDCVLEESTREIKGLRKIGFMIRERDFSTLCVSLGDLENELVFFIEHCHSGQLKLTIDSENCGGKRELRGICWRYVTVRFAQ